jgi:hypothetical protein
MAEIAAWKIPDIDNVSDAAIEEAWRDWSIIEMGKRYVLITASRSISKTRDIRALCLAFLHDCSQCIYFSIKVSVPVFNSFVLPLTENHSQRSSLQSSTSLFLVKTPCGTRRVQRTGSRLLTNLRSMVLASTA